jgi:hypothetical protein
LRCTSGTGAGPPSLPSPAPSPSSPASSSGYDTINLSPSSRSGPAVAIIPGLSCCVPVARAGRHQRARAGVPPPRADAEQPRAVHGAVRPPAEGRRRGARAGRPRRRGAPAAVQPPEARGVLQVALLRGRAQVRGSTQGVLRCGEGRSHGLMEACMSARRSVRKSPL